MADNKILLIMERVGSGRRAEDFVLYACRGEGKGCTRNRHRNAKKHCDDCVLADDPNETIAEFKARMERGNA